MSTPLASAADRGDGLNRRSRVASLAAQAVAVAGIILAPGWKGSTAEETEVICQAQMEQLIIHHREVKAKLAAVARRREEMETDTSGLRPVQVLLHLGGLGPELNRKRHKQQLRALEQERRALELEGQALRVQAHDLLCSAVRDLLAPRWDFLEAAGDQEGSASAAEDDDGCSVATLDVNPRRAFRSANGWRLQEPGWVRLALPEAAEGAKPDAGCA